MNGEIDYSKFTSSFTKFVSKVKNSLANIKSTQYLDRLLEEEYETLVKEINYLTSEKSCYLSFKNEQFANHKSSEDLSKVLENYSEEVLKNYIARHAEGSKKKVLNNRDDLVNYVTEIVVQRPHCNTKVCRCKPGKISKEVLTDKSKHHMKETQTKNVKQFMKNKNDRANQAQISVNLDTSEVQTDDPDCTCRYCSKRARTVLKEANDNKYATTSDEQLTQQSNKLLDCTGETVDEFTSTARFCVPPQHVPLLMNKFTNTLHICTAKRDCSCEVLILPSSDICIQRKKVEINEKTSQKANKRSSSNETSTEVERSDGDTNNTSRSSSNKKKEKKSKQKSNSSGKSNNSTPRSPPKKENKKGGRTGCFGGKKKKKLCDDHCQGIVQRQCSVQTVRIETNDKSEEVTLYGKNERKPVQTSTNSEIGIQVHPSKEVDEPNKQKDIGISSKEDKETKQLTENIETKRPRKLFESKISENKATETEKSQEKNSLNNEEYGNKDASTVTTPPRERVDRISQVEKESYDKDDHKREKRHETNLCNKCGRQKRDCNSGCRNTIIIPYASRSNRNIQPGEAESLRMLIKMQKKDTNRQFDSILTELSHQKSEIRRLNDMYQKMVGSFYERQEKSTNSTRSPTKLVDVSQEYDRKSVIQRACGCSFSNECAVDSSLKKASDWSAHDSNKTLKRRFGPPNTAVSINRCETCTTGMAGDNSSVRTQNSTARQERINSDKNTKELINEFKKAKQMANLSKTYPSREQEDTSFGETGSVSTISKPDTKFNKHIKPNETKLHQEFSASKDYKNNYAENEEIIQILSFDKTDGVAIESGNSPKHPHSSKVIVWLRKSWITMKNQAEKCHEQSNEAKKKKKAKEFIPDLFPKRVKYAATEIWKGSSICEQKYIYHRHLLGNKIINVVVRWIFSLALSLST